MNAKTPIESLVTLGLVALLATGLTADAQQRAGSDGRALDANQQVGSGGYNPADGRLDFSQQNNIITGNVGGGRGFQDIIDYRAVGEFTDTLGSDELFPFRARSLSSSPGYLNAVNVGGVGPQRNLSVYRSFTNRSAQPRPSGLIAPDGGGFQLVPTESLYSTPGGRYSSFLTQPIVGGATPGRAIQAFSIAPTLGLRGQLRSQTLSRKLYEAGQEANVLEPPTGMIAPRVYNAGMFDPYGKSKDKQGLADPLTPGLLPATLIIGQQLQTLDSTPDDAEQADDPQRSQRLLDAVFRPLDDLDAQAQADEADPYLKLLRDIRNSKDDKSPGEDVDDSGWENALETPTRQQVTKAERAFDKIMVEMYGEGYRARRERRRASSQAEPGTGIRGVVEQLNYDLPRLKTLASNRQTRIARMTLEAEAALADGKYLTAESRYRQIILDTDRDPLPRAGLVHAQLGAGMFRSAGLNLRALFAKHPELIAARYDARLLPPKDRLQWVQQELQTAISQGEGGKEAPILLAYLGYQASSRQIVRYGLALAQAQSPRDPLLAVLREIWLDGEITAADGE